MKMKRTTIATAKKASNRSNNDFRIKASTTNSTSKLNLVLLSSLYISCLYQHNAPQLVTAAPSEFPFKYTHNNNNNNNNSSEGATASSLWRSSNALFQKLSSKLDGATSLSLEGEGKGKDVSNRNDKNNHNKNNNGNDDGRRPMFGRSANNMTPRYFEIDDLDDYNDIDNDEQHHHSLFKVSSASSSSTNKGKSSNRMLFGSGREFDLFDNRGGAEDNSPSDSSSTESGGYNPSKYSSTSGLRRKKRRSSNSYSSFSTRNYRSSSSSSPSPQSSSRGGSRSRNPFHTIKTWITSSNNLPRIQCRVEPNTTLKVRKTFRPLKTIVRLGADFNTQLGVWQFKSSWEDSIIGGKLTLAGRELQFTKTWLLSVGAVEDLVTRLRLRASVDLGTMKAYARLGFRTERLSPINVVEGFTLMKRLPLDGTDGHVKLEVKANFAFPEPEIEYSTENHRSFVGMGDIEVNIDELNLLLDY